MPKALVTQEAVFDAADALVAAGAEPSLRNVQERLGGGSYTTVKRFLDQWKVERQTARRPGVEAPEEVAAQGQAFVRQLWAVAAGVADARVAEVQAQAERQVAEARSQLADAEAAIARLEAESEAQAQRIAAQEQIITQLRGELTEAQRARSVAEARVAELEQRLGDLKAELAQAHRQIVAANERVDQAGRAQLADELAAIKQQLQEQAATIARLSGGA